MYYGPAYHRRQAEILTRISKTVSNVDAAAALFELAAKHWALADEGERERKNGVGWQPFPVDRMTAP